MAILNQRGRKSGRGQYVRMSGEELATAIQAAGGVGTITGCVQTLRFKLCGQTSSIAGAKPASPSAASTTSITGEFVKSGFFFTIVLKLPGGFFIQSHTSLCHILGCAFCSGRASPAGVLPSIRRKTRMGSSLGSRCLNQCLNRESCRLGQLAPVRDGVPLIRAANWHRNRHPPRLAPLLAPHLEALALTLCRVYHLRNPGVGLRSRRLERANPLGDTLSLFLTTSCERTNRWRKGPTVDPIRSRSKPLPVNGLSSSCWQNSDTLSEKSGHVSSSSTSGTVNAGARLTRPVEMLMDPVAVHNGSSPEAKVSLFRALFRGREDVYARRFESRKTGTSGYSPVCANEWVRGVCDKPRTKCSSCPHQQFQPITDEVIRRHLSGKDQRGAHFVAGVYPMLLDETCRFLAMDFDKTGWRVDARAVLATCTRIAVSTALERSRSGNGGHVWMFFEGAIPAAMARRLGAHILTETMEHRPEIGQFLTTASSPIRIRCRREDLGI